MQRTFHFPKGYCHGAPVRKMALLILSGVMLGCLATGAVAKTWVLSVAVAGSMTPDDEKYLYVPSYRFAQELAGKTGFSQNHMQQPSVPGEDIDLLFYGLAVTTDSALGGGSLRMRVRHVGLDIQNADRKDIRVESQLRPNSPFDSKADLKRDSLSYLVERLQPEWDGLILVADDVEAKDFNLYDKKHRFVQVVHPVRMAKQVNGDRLQEDMRNAVQEFVAYVDSQCQVDVPTVRMLEETQKIYPQQDVKLEVTAKNAEKIAVAWGDAGKESQAEGGRVRFSHAYQKPGKYTVEFRGIRGAKESASGKKTIVVLPLPPAPTVIVSDEAPRLKVGEEKMLLIRCSGEDFTGVLDLGVFGGRQELQRGQNIALKYDIAGSYDIVVEARNQGGITKKRINVTVEAAEPVIELQGVRRDGLTVEVQYRVKFADSAQLSFGDGSGVLRVAQEGRKEHTYGSGGTYTVTLEAGAVRRAVRVEVAEKVDTTAPVLWLDGAEQDGNGAVTVSFQASNVLWAELQFGDGTKGEQVEGQGMRTHAYKTGGRYQIRLLAQDKDGQDLEPKVLDVDVEGPEILPPVLDLYGLRTEGLDVEVTTYVMNTTMAELDFGDRSGPVQVEAGEFLVKHHYDLEGEYTLTLTCEGGTPATKEVSVEAPVVEPLHVEPVVKDATGTVLPKDGNGQIHALVGADLQFVAEVKGGAGKVQWYFEKGARPETGRTKWHSFSNAGTYVVKLNVLPAEDEDDESDESGAAKEYKLTMVVDEKPFPAILLLVFLAVLGAGGWVAVRAVLHCPKSVYSNKTLEGKFNLMTNQVSLPGAVTQVGDVTLKACKKGVVAVKAAEAGVKVSCESDGKKEELSKGKMTLLRELFGEAKAVSTELTLIGQHGTKCEIKLE